MGMNSNEILNAFVLQKEGLSNWLRVHQCEDASWLSLGLLSASNELNSRES